MISIRNARALGAAALLLFLAFASPAADNVTESEQRLKSSVTYLSSDELEGRGVGTQGLNKAADFLAAEFTKLGLKTDLFDGTPFQKFPLDIAVEMGPAEQNQLVLVGPADKSGQPTRQEFKLGESFNPLSFGSRGQFDAPLVFAGYGITAENLKKDGLDFKYDDYAGLDVKGKVVIVFRKEPQQQDPKSPFSGVRPSPYAEFDRKLANAADHGAAAVIFINDGLELEMRREDSRKLLGDLITKLAKLGAEFPGLPGDKQAAAASEIRQAAEQAAELHHRLVVSVDKLLDFSSRQIVTTKGQIPALFATRAAIEPIVKSVLSKDLAAVEQAIDAALVPHSAELGGWRAVGQTSVIQKSADVKNVIAVLEGEGPLANETIVIGAHYDHLGLGGMGSLAPWTAAIHNGADDNASGTATLLEIANRLATSGQKPQRRIVFVAFTGEERGLWGGHYVRNPRFSLEDTIAMFNLDMVGRLTDEKLIVYGTGTAREFEPLVESFAPKHGFKLTKDPAGYGPSDHNSFYEKKIPVLHLFTGLHSDYHRPSDDAPKLNIEGMRRVADYLTEIIRATDARAERPTYVEIKRIASIAPPDGEASERPYFGGVPAYPNPEKDGVLLNGVGNGSPAEKAGIQGGDVLLSIGEHPTVTLEDYQAALVSFKPGDKVKVKVRRGKEMVEGETVLTQAQPALITAEHHRAAASHGHASKRSAGR